jgi:hypothetical protein
VFQEFEAGLGAQMPESRADFFDLRVSESCLESCLAQEGCELGSVVSRFPMKRIYAHGGAKAFKGLFVLVCLVQGHPEIIQGPCEVVEPSRMQRARAWPQPGMCMSESFCRRASAGARYRVTAGQAFADVEPGLMTTTATRAPWCPPHPTLRPSHPHLTVCSRVVLLPRLRAQVGNARHNRSVTRTGRKEARRGRLTPESRAQTSAAGLEADC